MKARIAAALALVVTTSLHAQTASPVDLGITPPIAGNWSWAQTADGSQASFTDASSQPQAWLRCARSTRTVTIAKPASAASPTLSIWTSSLVRDLPARFDSATGQLSASLPAFDPILDALAASRGRIGITVAGTPPLVLPAWAEIARVVEDCRV